MNLGRFTSVAIELNHKVKKPLTYGFMARIGGTKYYGREAPGYCIQIGAGITIGLGWWFTKTKSEGIQSFNNNSDWGQIFPRNRLAITKWN